MSFLTDKAKFNVKTSNLSTVAKFSSTLDDAYFLILANNSNNYGCNNSAAVFGANSSSNFEAYIGLADNNVINKLARFNNYDITFNRNITITGNVVPTSNIAYDLGSPDFRWRDLYLSGNSIYVGDTILTSDPESGSLTIKNSSNEIAPFVASKLKLVSSGTSSNYSVLTSTDYGVNLTFYDENDMEINHLDLGQGDTSMLPEGSNLYYTTARFDERLLSKTLDDIRDGTSNRYIINDVYSRDLHVTGSLFASNLTVYGDRTTLNTETYQTEQLQITSDANGPVLTVTQLGENDILHVASGSNMALLVNNAGYVGINKSDPFFNLDVSGTTNSTFLRGDGSQLSNVNLQDRDTSLLAEGSNLYYTSERVGVIATSSNLDTSNYIFNTSNEISARLTDTSNIISDRLTDTSNLISNRITDTSNLISDRLTDTSNVISDRLTDTSNVISDRITDTSNLISNRITDLTTSEIFEGSNLFYTVERFDERLLTKTLDDVNNGTSNKYIINDIYNSDLKVTGTLTASNLIVNGTYTTLDTITYQSKKMEIVSDSESPALLVKQDGASNIMEIYDDSNIVLSIINDGFVGINILTPQHALDVNGTVNATSFIGDGIGLYNVNLTDRTTSLLAEGCNLYYTSERVGIISTSSNLETSNYILNSSNAISTTMTETSNQISTDLTNTSNQISTRITNLNTNDIAEGLNLFYTDERFDVRLETKTADYVAEGTSNKYIVNNVYNNDLTITGTLTASNLIVSGDISTLNTNTYQTERMEIISDVNGPALTITQKGTSDVLHIYDDDTIALSVVKGGNVGVHTITPEYTLDVVGTTRASFFIGDGAGLSNVNLQDRDTSLLAEGSNLYYTAERVGVIATASNILTSNYVFETSNLLITKITDTSNILTDTINNVVSVEIDNTLAFLLETSNLLIENIIQTSNILTYGINETINTEISNTNSNLEYTSNMLAMFITATSNQLTDVMNNVVNSQGDNSSANLTNSSNEIISYITNTSNALTDTINNVVSVQILNTSNLIVNTSNLLTDSLNAFNTAITTRIDNLTTNQIAEGSNLYYTDARFNTMLLTKTLDDINNGTSNRYIINDKYEGDLYVAGTLTTSNLIVNGNTTTLNTTTYQSKKLEIVSDAIGPALKVQQNGIFDIMQVYDDSNMVLSIVNGGKVGINTSNPLYTLDVVGTTRANYLIGDGAGLTNVNLKDRDTSMLVEGSNLYYTSERVGVISSASNVDTSNYILNTSNVISDRLTVTSNVLDAYIFNTSNTLYANLVQSSNLISINLLNTSNTLMTALIENSNLSVNTSNEILITLQETYYTATSNFTVNSNLLSTNILDTSNALVNLVNYTYSNITGSITDTSNILINNILNTSNNTISFTNATFDILNNNLNITSNQLTSNIPIIFNQLQVNLNNVSNLISSQLNTNSNVITTNILANSNLFVSRILDTSNLISNRITSVSNLISTRITDTSNQYATDLTLTSNKFDTLFQTTSNAIYTYFNQTSNSLSTDVVYNSNAISDRITNLDLDMIKAGSSNTFVVNNIYDANLTITGSLTVNTLDVIDLGLLVLNETGEYINTDMKTYVAKITSNVLVSAPAIIQNSTMNFDKYDKSQSNYVATKQDIIKGAASTITAENLLPNRIVISNHLGKLTTSTVLSSNLDNIASLNAPVQTQINNLTLGSSNLALNILDQISLLNSTIGEGNGGTGNNLSATNLVTTCNLINIDPIVYMKFDSTKDYSRYASKNYVIAKNPPTFSGHTSNIILWYPFKNNANHYLNNADYNLVLINGAERYSPNINGIGTVILDGSTIYKMGAYNNVKPVGVNLFDNNNDITMSFLMNLNDVSGRKYIFSFATSNLFTNEAVIEAYVHINNLTLSVSRGATSSTYTVPSILVPNIDYNVVWKISKDTANSSNAISQLLLNGANFGNIQSLLYPLNSNYTNNIIGGHSGTLTTSYFKGYIGDFRVYNKSLNDNEIADNSLIKYPEYEAHKNDLLLWYTFDGHLQNYDSQPKYALNGTGSYLLNTGLSSYALNLNGSTYYTMNTGSDINFKTVSDIYPTGLTFSVSFIPLNNATHYLFSMTDTQNTATPTRSIEMYITGTQLNFRVKQNSTTDMQTVTLNTSLVLKNKYTCTWVISAGTTDGNASWYIYLNGANIYKSEFDRFYPTTALYKYNYIGSLYNNSLFYGYIDDFRVYKKALNPTEVMKINVNFISTKSFATNTDNLISWYNFDNDYNNSIIDNTIPLMYLNFKDKKMMSYYDNNNYILYNSSNITPVYTSIDNFTSINSGIPDYSSDNSTTLSTNFNRYVYYTDTAGISNVLGAINKKGFALHFAFSTTSAMYAPLFYSGNASKSYFDISVYYGSLFIVVGSGTFKIDLNTNSIIDANMWYVVDFVATLKNGVMTYEVYVNGVRQSLTGKYLNVMYNSTSNISLEYKGTNLQYGGETTGMYIGAYTKDTHYTTVITGSLSNGAFLTTTYYSSNTAYYDYSGNNNALKTPVGLIDLLKTSPSSSNTFNTYITTANNNKYYAYRNSTNLTSNMLLDANLIINEEQFLTSNNIITSSIDSLLVELNTVLNITETGFYHFALDLQNEIACDLILYSGDNKYSTVVSSYYGGSLTTPSNTINNTNVLQLPMKLFVGNYKLSLKILRKSFGAKTITALYYKYPSYVGDFYTFLTLNRTYINYTLLPNDVKTGMTNMNNKFFLNYDNKVEKYSTTNTILTGNDIGLYSLGFSHCNYMGIGYSNIYDGKVLQRTQFTIGDYNESMIGRITQVDYGTTYALFLANSGKVYYSGIINSLSSAKLKEVPGENGIGLLTGIIQISASEMYSLFLHNSGIVYGWGENTTGQLGINSTTNSSVLKQVLGENGSGVITGITQISTSYLHSLFLHNTGIVYACGNNNYGQLGINSLINSTTLKQVLGVDGSGFITDIIQVSAGGRNYNNRPFSYFLHNTGIAYSCGDNGHGQLGGHSYSAPYRSSVLKQVLGVGGVGFISGITSVSSGDIHVFLLHNTGIVYCCGNTASYRQGGGAGGSTFTQVLGVNGVGFMQNITQVIAYSDKSYLIDSSGIVYSCGRTKAPFVNQEYMYFVSIPIGNGSGYTSGFTHVACDKNDNRTTLIHNSGNVYSCGINDQGQLGINNYIGTATLTPIVGPSRREIYNSSNIIKVVPFSAGNSTTMTNTEYSMILDNSGAVYFTGESHYANVSSDSVFNRINGLNSYKIVDIACGGSDTIGTNNYSLFLTNTGNVLYTPSNALIKNTAGGTLTDVASIACRKNNTTSYYVLNNGDVLQNTTLSGNSTFVSGINGVGTLKNIKQVDAGLSYTIFLSNSGEVYGLGDNTYGQLGTGNNTTASTVTYMKGLDGVTNVNNIVKISCGNYYTMLLAQNTRVYATGYNVGGILGVGNTSNINVLKEVVNLDGVGALTGIRDISCGVANITPLYAAVLLLGNNNVYINGGSNGTLMVLEAAQSISSNVQSIHAAGSWLFLNTLKYDKRNLLNDTGYAKIIDEVASSNMYKYYDTNFSVNMQDFRLYTPEIMGTSNVISTQLSKGVYNPPAVEYPNNMLLSSNTTFDTKNFYSGYSALSFNSSNSSYAYLPANSYDFAQDTTLSLWVKADNSAIKYPQVSFTSNNGYSVSSYSNMDSWKCFDNNTSNTSNSLNLNSFTQIYGIGYNVGGQLGDGTTTNRTTGYVPMIVPSTLTETFIQIEGTGSGPPAGTWFVHLLSDSGKVYYIQTTGLTLINPSIFNNEKISFIASGGFSTYFITESGLLYAYGANDYYQLGNGNTTTLSTPTLIPASGWNGEKLVSVSTGDKHTFITTVSGTIFSIGYNNSGQLGNSSPNSHQTSWTVFTFLSNISKIYCNQGSTFFITNSGLLYSAGFTSSSLVLHSFIPSTKKIIKVSMAVSTAFFLADDGTLYGYNNTSIMPAYIPTSAPGFVEISSSVWNGNKVVDVVTGNNHTFYTLNNGAVYVVGDNNYGQLNIPTSTTTTKIPILVNVNGAKINLIYTGLSSTAYNIIITYPTKNYLEFNGNSGEYIKFDAVDNIAINYARISLNTPFSTTTLSYALSMKLYATNSIDALTNSTIAWDLLGTYDGTLSYSATTQNINIANTSSLLYRYYAVVINSRYNIAVAEIGLYINSSIASKKVLLDACIDEYNYVNISLQSSNITASVCNNSNLSLSSISNPDIYSSGVLYTFSYKYNTDITDSTWKIYTNGVLAKTEYPKYYPESGSYSTIVLGKSTYPQNGVYNYFSGDIDDFRIYNKTLSDEEVSKNYTSLRFNVEGYTVDNYINKYAMISSSDMYVYNNNYGDTYSLLKNIDTNGFTIHFVFKTNNVNNAPIYFIGGTNSNRISIKVLSGMLYIMLGSELVVVSKTMIATQTWYIVDLVGAIVSGKITLQLYLNNVLTEIYLNSVLNTKHTTNYSNLLSPDNAINTGIYLGAYNTIKSTSNIARGAVFTNRYFSSNLIITNTSNALPDIITRTALNSVDFSNIIVNADLYASYKLSSNVIVTDSEYFFNYDGSNYLYNNYISYNNSTTSYILTEIDANIKLSTGYYYFMNDITSDITAEMYIGLTDMRNVANYYGTSLDTGSGVNKTSLLPIYIHEGYYKFHSKIYSKENRKYIHHKYIKLENYTGDYYTLLRTVIDYQDYNVLDISVRNSAVGINDNLFINNGIKNNILLKNEGSANSLIYKIGGSNYQPSDYLTGLTSNYTVATTSNYLIGMTSNYTVDATSNYTLSIDYTSNYTLLYTSNYDADMTSNYVIDMMSNYTVEEIEYTSNYTMDYTSNYIIPTTSNYSIDYTSNYTISTDTTSNYSIDITSNYNINGTSNYNALLTSNYIGIYKPDYSLPQILYGANLTTTVKGITSIANGAVHTIIMKFDGSVLSIGNNLYGQLGLNSTATSTILAPVLDVSGSSVLNNIIGISTGSLWSHFIKRDGTVYGCGQNAFGQLGDNTTTQRNRIVAVLEVSGAGFLTNVKQVVGGFGTNYTTLFLKNDGTVFGCGQNAQGTLGDNTNTQKNRVVQMLGVGGVGFMTGVKQISMNATNAVILLNNGTVFSCGLNTNGQIGDNSTSQRYAPVQVIGVDGFGFLANIAQVSANGESAHTLFLSNDGSVYACGLNTSGQLGNNTTTQSQVPIRVFNENNNGYMSGISYVTNSIRNSYFIKNDGTILSCGNGTLGQIGNGSNINTLTPKYVMRDSSNIMYGASVISTGGTHSVNFIYNNGVKQLVKDNTFYIENNQIDNLEVLVQDFRIYNTGSLLTSNLVNLNKNDNYSYVSSYLSYNEITDGNRWMKSSNYYLYTNGTINRSIYYNEGNVGIGTSAPSASLDIYSADASIYSIKTNNSIWAQTGVISSSDSRIKKNICDIDDLSALNQILKIEPKTYNYVDTNRGKSKVFGFIAQQINEVIPEAVSIQTECIPNIYMTGSVQGGNIISVGDDISDKLHIGDSVEIVVKNGTKIQCEVMEVITDRMFRINADFDEDTIFVYGVVVDDFHTIDKNYIYTLNVCATQDLHRQITSNQERIDKQNEVVKSLIQKMETMTSNVII